jgi:hypothetical protein
VDSVTPLIAEARGVMFGNVAFHSRYCYCYCPRVLPPEPIRHVRMKGAVRWAQAVRSSAVAVWEVYRMHMRSE